MRKTLLLLTALIIIALLLLISFLATPIDDVAENPRILMETELGNIRVELYSGRAPITTSNFLKYIDENRLDDATFYRTVRVDNQDSSPIKIAVVQGGLFEDNHPMMLAAIAHENTAQTRVKHLDGVISMARYTPGTATSEFFICIGDQPSLDYGGKRNGDGAGFAAFGKVFEGMDIVQQIHQSTAEGQYLKPRIKILSISREKKAQ